MVMYDRMELLISKKGWSKSEFLRRVGLNSSAMVDWRAGKASPVKHLSRIASLLDTTEAYLRGETDNPTLETTSESAFSSNDLSYVLMSESQDLTDEEKQQIIDFMRFLKSKKRQ